MKYINKKGLEVTITVTRHAASRFRERWKHAFPHRVFPIDWEPLLEQQFLKAVRVTAFSYKDKERLEKHGVDTLYFKNDVFQFVIQDTNMVTVELCAKGMRALNKVAPPLPQPKDSFLEGEGYRLSALVRVPEDQNREKVVSLGRFRSALDPAILIEDRDGSLRERALSKLREKEILESNVINVRILTRDDPEEYLGSVAIKGGS